MTCLATAMLMLDIAVVNTAMAHIGGDLHASLDSLKWVVDAYTLALATTVLTVGSLADRFGRRNVFAAGLVVFTVASLACALADSIAMLERRARGAGHRRVRPVRLARSRCSSTRSRRSASATARWPSTARRSARRSPSARSSAAR